MVLPERLVLHASNYWLDGGTTTLMSTDDTGEPHSVLLVQSLFPGGNTFGIPGRLSFDNELIPLRSELESQIVALLRTAEVRYIPPPGETGGERIKLSPDALLLGDDIKQVLSRGPEENISALRDQIVERVESAV